MITLNRITSAIFLTTIFLVFFPLVMGRPALSQEAVPELPRRDFTDAPSFKVVRVVDGNTIIVLLHEKEREVRLIGVDTGGVDIADEETQNRVKLTTFFLQKLLIGESVYLMRDRSCPESDESGRTLAYVYRAPDGLFVNLELVRQGFAQVTTKYPFAYSDLFTFYENKALASGKGFASAPKTSTQGSKKTAPRRIVITDEDLREDGINQPGDSGKPSKRQKETEAPELSVSVFCIDYSFQIYNDNLFPWRNVKIEVFSEITKDAYVYKLDYLGPGRLIDIPGVDFENADGKRFDLNMMKPEELAITCDTPWGKAYFKTEW